MAFRFVPILLLKAKMAETIVDFGGVFAASVFGVIQRAFQLLHRFVQLSRGRQFDGRSQTARKSRPLRLRRNRSRISPQKTLDEIVVYEENLLSFSLCLPECPAPWWRLLSQTLSNSIAA